MKKSNIIGGLILILVFFLLIGCEPLPLPTTDQSDDKESPTEVVCPAQPEAAECPTQPPCPTQVAPTPQPCPSAEPCPICPEAEDTTSILRITGSFNYSNEFVVETYMVEHLVALADMTGFVLRDREWEIPVESQTLGYMKLDSENNTAEYFITLPAQPEGVLNDVNPDGRKEKGVQIFAVAYWPNLSGDPYSVGDDRSLGWATYLTSVITDSENQDEVIGGKLLVWSPDAEQSFPAGFGEDGLLFTDDDPTMPIPAGYSVIDLDQEPFAVLRDAEQEITLYEPQDIAIKDFSDLSYSEAFDKMVEILRKEYAFNGIEGKQPDWDALVEQIRPKVLEAEANQDATAYYLALREFTWNFKDGHVGLGSADNLAYPIFMQETSGGYGFAIRELDDGTILVIYVLENGPAAQAGMKVGAVVSEWNGEPIADAISKVQPLSAPHSTDFAMRYQQARYLLRKPIGTEISVTFTNPGETAKTVTLAAIDERESFSVTSIYAGAETAYLPVDFKVLESGVGYVRINSNYDDLNLVIRLFERALKTFEQMEVPGIIIDLRYNSGGSPLGLAGFLTDQEIILGQLNYYSDKTGKFEPEGLPEKVYPNENQYRFDKMALLVGQACFSACEIEAYGFSQVPGMIVVGTYPTGGVEAEVGRGQFALPDGISMQFPTGRFTLPDGSIFLEGTGVQPNLRVPITAETVLADEDVELAVAEKAVLLPFGAGVTPEAPPKLIGGKDAETLLLNGAAFLEDLARETYSPQELAIPNKTFPYTIALNASKPVVWAYGWCAKDKATLKQNFDHIQVKFILEGNALPEDQLTVYEYSSNGMQCRLIYVLLDEWKGGEHHLETQATFDAKINDGTAEYEPGTSIFQYTVYVKP